MEPPLSLSNPHCWARTTLPRRGVALVIVMVSLVLLTALVIAFFSTVATELSSSKQYASGATSRQLADSVVQMATAQIIDATKGFSSKGARLSWASQPGMIRTYNDAGNPEQYYKLYSSDQMVVDGAVFDPSSERPATSMATDHKAIFTDINEPVLAPDASGSIVPDAKKTDAKFSAFYPIIDPMAIASKIEGFSVEGLPESALPGPGDNPAVKNPLPMPVRWLYVLADGRVIAPAGTGNTATVTGASKANPIIGRVAFWTDDETAKININTAAEGVAWDTPRANTDQERGFATSQPFQKEFQRYPGHPATTALSPVFFPGLDLTDPARVNERETLYKQIAPRITDGGSKGGTEKWQFANAKNGWDSSKVLKPKADRLYATVDELLLKPDRPENPLVTPQAIERAKFFLTANSRSPEVNLFNQPRVSVWPVYNSAGAGNNSKTTAFDRMIAFCSTIGSGKDAKRFYFQREKSTDAIYDYASIPRNQELYSYLKRLTENPIPGFGGDFKKKYPGDRDQILTEIFDYIRMTNLFDDTLNDGGKHTYWPWGSSLADLPQYTNPRFLEWGSSAAGTAKYQYWPGHGQVTPIRIGTTQGFGRYTTISEVGIAFICNIDPGVMRPGFISAADPVTTKDESSYVKATDWYTPGPASSMGFGDLNGDGVADSADVLQPGVHRVIQAAIFLEGFCPAMGEDGIRPDMHLHIKGLEQLRVRNAAGELQSLGLPANDKNAVVQTAKLASQTNSASHPCSSKIAEKYAMMGDERSPLRGGVTGPRHFARWMTYPFYGNKRIAVTVPADGTMEFIGNDQNGDVPIEIEIRQGLTCLPYPMTDTTQSGLVQTIKLVFPSGTFPIPELVAGGTKKQMDSSAFDKDRVFTSDWEVPRRIWWNWFSAPTPTKTYAQMSRLDARDPDNTTTTVAADPGYATQMPSKASSITKPGVQGGGALFRVDVKDYLGNNISATKRDVVRSLVPRYNDPRLIAAQTTVEASSFLPHPEYHNSSEKFAHSFLETEGEVYGGDWKSSLYFGVSPSDLNVHRLPDTPLPATYVPTGAYERGDWDNGPGWSRDGTYINKSDDGNVGHNQQRTFGSIPYFNFRTVGTNEDSIPGPTYFSPNRKVPSPGMLGSLPTGVKAGVPFQTLLFRPDATFAAAYKHPGGASPKDHLFLDLFTMPVVEPYAISEPLSTAGKVNLNYQIMPFNYIKRETAVRAVLKNELVTAIPNNAKGNFKWVTGGKAEVASSTEDFRHAINVDETLKGFERRFAPSVNHPNGDLFRSASEICDIHLVPKISGVDYDTMDGGAFWPGYKLTGDNTRERPYTNIYSRITTKSNTYTIHMRVQALRKAPGTAADTWVEGRDLVASEFRGSAIVERYIDVNDPRLPDFATDPNANIDDYYRFRVVSTKQFSP